MERFHLSLKTSLQAQLAGPDWVDHLPLVLLGLHPVPRDDSGFSATEALYKIPLCLPGEFLNSDEVPPDAFLERIQSSLRGMVLPPPHHQPPSAAQVPAAPTSPDLVFVLKDASIRPLSQLYRGPFKILARSIEFFTLQMGSRTHTVSIDCLKPIHGPDPVVQQPPRLGWPPRPVPVAVPGLVVPVPVVPAVSSRQNPPRRARFLLSSP